MNDYLKNQLVKGEVLTKKYSNKNISNPEMELLRM